MINTVLRAALLGSAMVLASVSADATVVTFDGLGISALPVSTGGLDFGTLGGSGFTSTWTSNSPNSNGTDNLIAGYGTGVTITKTGGGNFTLNSIQMSISWYNSNAVENILINGIGYSIFQALNTISLNLVNVSSVSITGISGGYWLADNVTYNASVVPIPAALPLLATGLAGVVALGRRRRANRKAA